MQTWSFQLVLNRAPSDEEVDQLYEAGLDDCSVIVGGAGQTSYIDCDRVADTLLDAVISVAAHVRTVPGLRAIGAGSDDSVTLRDAAQRLGRSAESMRLLADGKRGPGGFPVPVVSTGNVRIFSWADIVGWMRHQLGVAVPDVESDLVLAGEALRVRDRAERMDEAHLAAVRRLVA
ncbi:MAG: hypothetical protein GEU83_02855 [Pseudonocardiaceae bacterium]|nr:hypothetical protein [Pseudonocardiaceae bacterium]